MSQIAKHGYITPAPLESLPPPCATHKLSSQPTRIRTCLRRAPSSGRPVIKPKSKCLTNGSLTKHKNLLKSTDVDHSENMYVVKSSYQTAFPSSAFQTCLPSLYNNDCRMILDFNTSCESLSSDSENCDSSILQLTELNDNYIFSVSTPNSSGCDSKPVASRKRFSAYIPSIESVPSKRMKCSNSDSLLDTSTFQSDGAQESRHSISKPKRKNSKWSKVSNKFRKVKTYFSGLRTRIEA